MNIKIIILSLLISIILSNSANAATENWTTALTINEIFVEDGKIVVYADGPSYGCKAGKYAIFMNTQESRDHAFSLLTTALAAGLKVMLYTKTTCHHWNFHKFSAVKIFSKP